MKTRDILKGILLLCVFGFTTMVSAEEIYYVNDNGVEFTQFQYETLSEFIGEENVKTYTQAEFDQMEIGNMTEENTTYTILEDNKIEDSASGITTYGAAHETASKKLTLSSVCNSSYCALTTHLNWKTNPKVRSYDVIGVRILGCQFYDTTAGTALKSGGKVYSYEAKVTASNGIGSVVKLTTGDVEYAQQVTHVKKGSGTVFASYQHSVKSISLATAKNFTFSGAGPGSVFNWSNNDLFDQMGGVSLAVQG